MSSPGVMEAHGFERMSRDPLNPQEAHGYPASYEEARRRILTELLSMPAATLEESEPTLVTVPSDRIASNPDLTWTRSSARGYAEKSSPLKGNPAGRKQRKLEEFSYVSSFDRVTAKKCTPPYAVCTSPNRDAPGKRAYSHGRACGRCIHLRVGWWRVPGAVSTCSQLSR